MLRQISRCRREGFLDRPQFREIGGINSIVGNAGGQQLALMNARDPQQLSGGGKLEVMIGLERGLKAEIVSEAVESANVRVVTNLQTDSTMRQTVRRISRE